MTFTALLLIILQVVMALVFIGLGMSIMLSALLALFAKYDEDLEIVTYRFSWIGWACVGLGVLLSIIGALALSRILFL